MKDLLTLPVVHWVFRHARITSSLRENKLEFGLSVILLQKRVRVVDDRNRTSNT